MHRNRLLYDRPSYVEKLRVNYTTLGLVLSHSKSGNLCVFRPVPSTPFLPEGRHKYFYKLRRRAENLNFSKKYSFATLTYSTNFYNPAEACKRIKHDIDLFFKRLNYRKSKPPYFYVIELTEKFMPHVHIIFAGYVHKKKIFKSWYKVTGCTSIRIQSLPFKKAIYYCTKYLTRSSKMSDNKWDFIFKNIDRIWSCSRDFFSKSDPEPKLWIFKELYCSLMNQHNDLFPRSLQYLKSFEMSQEDFTFLLDEIILDYRRISFNTSDYYDRINGLINKHKENCNEKNSDRSNSGDLQQTLSL